MCRYTFQKMISNCQKVRDTCLQCTFCIPEWQTFVFVHILWLGIKALEIDDLKQLLFTSVLKITNQLKYLCFKKERYPEMLNPLPTTIKSLTFQNLCGLQLEHVCKDILNKICSNENINNNVKYLFVILSDNIDEQWFIYKNKKNQVRFPNLKYLKLRCNNNIIIPNNISQLNIDEYQANTINTMLLTPQLSHLYDVTIPLKYCIRSKTNSFSDLTIYVFGDTRNLLQSLQKCTHLKYLYINVNDNSCVNCDIEMQVWINNQCQSLKQVKIYDEIYWLKNLFPQNMQHRVHIDNRFHFDNKIHCDNKFLTLQDLQEMNEIKDKCDMFHRTNDDLY